MNPGINAGIFSLNRSFIKGQIPDIIAPVRMPAIAAFFVIFFEYRERIRSGPKEDPIPDQA